MAHNLNFVNGKAQMVSTFKTWHGHETLTENPMIGQEAFVFSGQSGINLVMEDIQTVGGFAINGFKALIEKNSQTLVHVHGEDYTPAEPWELYKLFAPYIEKLGGRYVTAGILKDYSKIWALAKVEGLQFNIGPRDNPIMPYFLSCIGYDGKIGFAFGTTYIQVVCQNTLNAALKGDINKFRQTKNRASRVANIVNPEVIAAYMEREAQEFSQSSNALASIPLTSALKNAFIEFILPSKVDKKTQVLKITDGLQEKRDMFDSALCNAPGIVGGQESAWSLYDAFTFAMTHQPTFAKREKTDSLEADLFGGLQAKREEAYSWLVENAR